MVKILSLTACLLSISSVMKFANAKETSPSKTCEVVIYSPESPPFCHTETDENGQPEEICEAIGSAMSMAVLNKDESTLKLEDFPVAEIEFSGSCSCEVRFYSKANFAGSNKKISFGGYSNKQIIVDQVWSKEANSFKVDCDF